MVVVRLFVVISLSVCNGCIVAKRYVVEKNFLLE